MSGAAHRCQFHFDQQVCLSGQLRHLAKGLRQAGSGSRNFRNIQTELSHLELAGFNQLYKGEYLSTLLKTLVAKSLVGFSSGCFTPPSESSLTPVCCQCSGGGDRSETPRSLSWSYLDRPSKSDLDPARPPASALPFQPHLRLYPP